jgi:hypothetical protein
MKSAPSEKDSWYDMTTKDIKCLKIIYPAECNANYNPKTSAAKRMVHLKPARKKL